MSGGEDTRILNMRINNKDFLRGTTDSLKALDTLNKGIDGAGKGKGMQDMAKGVDTVKTKFSALQVAGITALANITNRAVNAGINMVKSLTFAPIMDGFKEYEKLLTSTQTISANTGLTSKKGLGMVNDALDQLNTYSDQTIYNFGQMADSIGKFTAAGGKGSLNPSVDAIKGLANSAALAGSDVNQLNTAMYQMSQAMSTGTIKLMDWNSLANAGMGGANMQNSLKLTARTFDGLGAKMDTAIKTNGSFRESLSEGWLSSEVFSKAMKVMGGTTVKASTSIEKLTQMGFKPAAIEAIKAGKSVAFSVKQLQKMGYSKEAAETLNKLSQSAIESATKIKTFTQLIDVVKESIGSGWAQIFRILFGDLKEAGKLWTTVGDNITGVIGRMFNTMAAVLEQWKKLGGYDKLWGAFGNIFKTIGNLMQPFLDILGAIAPGTENAGKSLYGMTNAFYQFTVWLEKATSGTAALTPVFEALGTVIRFVFGAFATYVGSMFRLLGLFKPLGEAVVDLASALGDLVGGLFNISGVGKSVTGAFSSFESIRADILTPFIDTLTDIVEALTQLVKSGDFSAFKQSFVAAFSNLGSLGDLYNQGKKMGSDLIDGLREGWSSGSIQESISSFVNKMLSFFKGLLGINSPSTVFMEYGRNILQGLAAGLKDFGSFIGNALMGLVNGIKSFGSFIGDAVGGLVKHIVDGVKSIDKFDLANVFSVIFGGMVFLSVRKFMKAFSEAFSTFAGFAESIMGDDGLLGQTTKTMKTMQTGIKAKALLNIALAIGVLAVSLWVLSKIPYDRLGTGMVAITAMLFGLNLTMKAMAANAATTKTAVASMTAMAFSMGLMAAAILLLSAAVFAFGMMPTDVLIKGGIAVGVALLALSGAAILLGKASPWMALAATGVLVMSVALLVLSTALVAFFGVFKLFEQISWGDMLNSLAKIAVVLVALGVAMIPLAAMAPGVLIASAALVILSVALTSMLGVIMLFSTISWGDLGSGVAKIAVALIAIGVAALVAAPGLILLGAAAVLLGAGLLAAGVGMTLLGAGFAVLVAAGVSGIAVLVAAFEAFMALLPLLAVQLVAALDAFLAALAEKAPSIVASVVKIGTALIGGLLDAITANAPKIFEAGINLILSFVDVLTEKLPLLIKAGGDLIIALIQGLGNNAAKFVVTAGQTILKFLDAVNLAVQIYAPQIARSARNIGINLVKGIAKGLIPAPVLTAISKLVTKVLNFFKGLLGIKSPSRVFMNFGKMIVQGLANGIRSFIGMVVGVVRDLASRIIGAIRKLPGQIGGALSSLGGVLRGAFSSAFNVAKNIVTNGIGVIRGAISKIPGIIRGILGSVGGAAKSVGTAIVNGIKNGLGAAIGAVGDLGGAVVDGIKGAVNSALNLPLTLPSIHINLPGPKDFDFGGGQVIIPHFAKGVTGFGGGSALVGEMGPELVTMGRGSNVITNEILTKFIKQVASLTRMLSSTGKNSPGGTIQYVVSADFQGDPKRDGLQFAANIVDGLIGGLKAQQSSVNSSMANVATGLSESFADVLEIRSPSKVFRKYAGYVGKGFIRGLLASVADVKRASRRLGEASIDAIAKTVKDGQLKLEALRGRANAYADAADELRARARKTKNKKEKKRLETRAKVLDRTAKKQIKVAKKQAKAVASAEAAAAKKAKYKAASTQGKADMDKADARSAASRASAQREKAIQLSKEADLVRKYDKKRAKAIDKAARASLRASKTLADRSEAYAIRARKLALQAKKEADKKAKAEALAEAQELATQLESVSAKDIAKAQTAFDNYAKSLLDAQNAAKQDIPPGEFKFEQNNYSPEAISPAEAYRNGKSLVSIMEKKLAPTP